MTAKPWMKAISLVATALWVLVQFQDAGAQRKPSGSASASARGSASASARSGGGFSRQGAASSGNFSGASCQRAKVAPRRHRAAQPARSSRVRRRPRALSSRNRQRGECPAIAPGGGLGRPAVATGGDGECPAVAPGCSLRSSEHLVRESADAAEHGDDHDVRQPAVAAEHGDERTEHLVCESADASADLIEQSTVTAGDGQSECGNLFKRIRLGRRRLLLSAPATSSLRRLLLRRR